MATIRDIAKRARVSTATVSYVINQSRFVSKELSDRVLEAVEQLEFTPSRAARSLRHGKTFTIGLLTGDVTHRFAGELINGLEEAALEQGY